MESVLASIRAWFKLGTAGGVKDWMRKSSESGWGICGTTEDDTGAGRSGRFLRHKEGNEVVLALARALLRVSASCGRRDMHDVLHDCVHSELGSATFSTYLVGQNLGN